MTVLRSSDGGRNWRGVASGLNTHVASLLVVQGVVFAGTNKLMRYPPKGGADSAATVINVLFLLALGVAGFFLLRRSRIRMQQMEQQTQRARAERMARERPWSVRARDGEPNMGSDENTRESAVSEDATSAAELEGNHNDGSR